MVDFVLISVHFGRIRNGIIGAISGKFAEAIIRALIQEKQTQRQEIVRSYQTTPMQHKTFISEMLKHEASYGEIVNVLVEEGCDLLEDGFVFEAQINQEAMIWGKRLVRTKILNNQEGKERLQFFEENKPLTLDVPRNLVEEHTLVAVNKNGEHKVCTTATNFPEVHRDNITTWDWDSIIKQCCDNANFKSNWASISQAQMRWIYRNRYKQKQQAQAQQTENPNNHVEEEPKNERQVLQYIQAEPAIPLNKYDAAGRNFHYGSIGLGVAVWFLTFASIWWLSDETRKEKKS